MAYVNCKKTNNTRPKHSCSPAPPRQLLGGIKPVDYLIAGRFKVKGFKDQHNNKFIVLNDGTNIATVRYDGGNDGAMWTKLIKQDVIVSTSRSRSEILCRREHARMARGDLFGDRAGLSPWCYVKPNGVVIGKPDVDRFHVDLQTVVPLAMAGTSEAWKTTVATFVQDQPVLVLALCTAFVGPILELTGADNVCLELVSPTSTGKTTALDLMRPYGGAPHKMPGALGISLRSTANGIEQHALARGGAALPADEVSLLGKNAKKTQGDSLFEIAFLLSEGVSKERHNDPASRARFSTMITSNTPIETLLQYADPEQLKAIMVRWISMPANQGPLGPKMGVIDRMPEGFATLREVIAALKAGVVANHGHAADEFLEQLLLEANRDQAELTARIERHRGRFMEAVGVDPEENEASRLAELLATIYAAGKLAARGVIPIKGIKAALVECYRRSTPSRLPIASPALSAIEAILAYVDTYAATLQDLDKDPPRMLRKAQSETHPGFLKTLKGRRCLLFWPDKWEMEFGVHARAMLEELNGERRLMAKDGYQWQTRIRKQKPKDRVYAVILNGQLS